jgi:hypothetical protein
VNRKASLILSVGVTLLVGTALTTMSCKSSTKSSDSVSAKGTPADAPPITGKQWRLEKETIAADNMADYTAGLAALRQLDAFGTMEVSKLFYHHNLVMVPAGTLIGETGPPENGAIRIRVLDGPQSGQSLWLYPESAEKMGFPSATPSP